MNLDSNVYLKLDVDNLRLHLQPQYAFLCFDSKKLPKRGRLKQQAAIKLNKVAGEIIEKMYEPLSLSEIVNYFCRKYNDTEENVFRNISIFFERLYNRYGISVIECKNKYEIKNSCFTKTGSWDYLVPFGLVLELTYRCNYQCKHCYNNSSIYMLSEMKTDVILSILEEAYKLGIREIELTGGEPTVYSNIEEFLKKLFTYNFELIGLLTNGSNLSEEICQLLYYNRERVVVQIDLHGSSPEYVRWFTGNEKAYYSAIDSIKKLSDLGIVVRVVCNVTSLNVEQMADVAEIAYKLGATAVAFGPIAPIGRAKSNNDLIISLDDKAFAMFEKNIENLIEKYGKNFISVIEEEIMSDSINCGVGRSGITLSPNLDVKICQMSDMSIGNLKFSGNSLKNFLQTYSMYFEIISQIPAPNKRICKECENLWFCNNCLVRGLMKAYGEGEDKCVWRKEFLKNSFLLEIFQKK
ncbi:radical SAM protein [Dictyoglomus thermophilum]|jgi:radical SAM protein with 4Fe4S-binding SPASM domain|uniref:Radical SAM domain protein n=1 Tax=Dictyoglomus thermophilum (strain ATCC 35947 / DSM 3960 / H-6-12) TaxID=309799 RepID=B5YBZ7_DICT6|nr:radical SAM protein [Dictyoglomus thermophilum]ACI19224.1 radical SAM domain protein [Dictyoglomus thermophilum H-6-12]TYT20324.1 radical SAM protein [Dictyoglomus thermophilum]